ncbi:MAG: tripartite tricarboxylate transporter substrate binding protein [Rhodospirillaceae bacterium]
MSYRIVLPLAAALAAAAPAAAQNFPVKPVRLIVPFAPGGSTDIMGRILGQKLSDMWGQQVVVDNRAGGGTIIGTEMAVNSPGDGYTLLLANIALALNPGLHSRLPFDPVKDLAPVTLIATQATAVAASPGFPANSVKELIAQAKAKTGGLSFGSSGTGGVGHIAGEMFRSAIGASMIHVPYKGGGPAAVDVMAGQIPLAFISLPTVMTHYKAGKLKVLAVTDSKRSAAAPDIPTIGETIPGYAVNNWIGMLMPAKTTRPLIHKVNADVIKAIRLPDAKEKLSGQGFDIQGSTPEEFGNMIRGDIAKYTKVIRQAGIKEN